MKRILAVLLVLVFAVLPLSGCGSKQTIKTGFAVITSVAKSADAGENDGLAQADSVIVAVLVDNNGKIIDCVIDQAQSKVNFNNSGELVTPLDAVFRTKNELGTEYGMGRVSGIGKEWNEQAAAFAKYVTGKTVDQVKNIAVSNGYPTSSDLTSSVTMHVTELIEGVEKAVANAKDLGAAKGDKLSVATVTSIAKSTNATATAPGLAQIYSTYVAMTQDKSGKITSAIFDASQSNINFDQNGKITTDLSIAPRTKNELKEAYGMGRVSSIGKEWYEQAASFADYIKGKTVAQVKGIAIDQSGTPTGSDLTSSVTIHVTDFITLVEKAAK
jgi:hypothetical protein